MKPTDGCARHLKYLNEVGYCACFCCVGRARENSVIHYSERSTLPPDRFSCLCSLVKHCRFLRSHPSKYAGTHKDHRIYLSFTWKVPFVQRLKECTKQLSNPRGTARGSSLGAEIDERKNRRAASHVVFNVTLEPFSGLAATLRYLFLCRIACS